MGSGRGSGILAFSRRARFSENLLFLGNSSLDGALGYFVIDSKATRHGTINISNFDISEFYVLCHLAESSGCRFCPKQRRQRDREFLNPLFGPVSLIAYRDAGGRSGRHLSDPSSSFGLQNRVSSTERKLMISATQGVNSA